MEICDIGYEPYEILKALKEHDEIRELLLLPNLSVLDLGCGIPMFNFVLYHDFNFKKLIGVDSSSEENAVEDYKRSVEIKCSNCKTAYDIYRSYLSFTQDEITQGKKHLSKTEFEKLFIIKFNLSVQEYLNNNNDKNFNLIILSNLIHLIPQKYEAKYIIDQAVKKLRKGGLLYVKINHTTNIIKNNFNQVCYNEVEFQGLFSNLKRIHSCIVKKKNNDFNQSMIFLGKK